MSKLMKLVIAAAMIACITPLRASPVPEKPAAPYLTVPKTATWEVVVVDTEKKGGAKSKQDAVVSMQCWLRGSDYKCVSTYASGITKTSVTIGGYTIEKEPGRKASFVGSVAGICAAASEEDKFVMGYVNPFSLFNWISIANFVRLESLSKRPVYVYHTMTKLPQLTDDPEPPTFIPWNVSIDADTKLPVATTFGSKLYQIGKLQVDVAISDDVFGIPEDAKETLRKYQALDAREKKFGDMLKRMHDPL